MSVAAPNINHMGGASASPRRANGARRGLVVNIDGWRASPSQRAARQNINTALSLAACGAFVFPCAINKSPLVKWRDESTTDPDQIERLWARFPGALVGLDCGKTNVAVVDADRHVEADDGVEALNEIVGDDLLCLGAPLVATPTNNGLHAYFRQPADAPLGNSRGALPRGVDIRARGGFTIAPGSLRPDGSAWRTDAGSTELADALANGTLPELPEALLRLIRAKPERPDRPEPPRQRAEDGPRTTGGDIGERERAFALAALDACVADVASAGEGSRNTALNAASFRLGRQIAAGRIGRSEVERQLEAAAQACGLVKDDGWPSVRASLRSGIEAGLRQPADQLQDRERPDARPEREDIDFFGGRNPQARRTIRVGDDVIDAETGEILSSAGEDTDAQGGGPHPENHAGAQAQDAASHPGGPSISVINAASFAGQSVPRQRWLIEGLIPAANVGILAGDGAVGKSLLALQLCVAVARGGEWIGFRPAAGKALYISCEDEKPELHRRLARLCPNLDALANLDLIDLAGKDAVMAAPDRAGLLKPTSIYTAIRHVVATHRPDLVVLDNLSDTFGGDELKRVHARQFIALMRGVALEFDTVVLILQHPSQSGLATGTGTSGSTGWSNGVRTRLFLERRVIREGGAQIEEDRDVRILSMKKANRSPLGDQIVIKWVRGRFEREEQSNLNVRDAAQLAERTFMDLLAIFIAQGRNVSAHKSSTYAPAIFQRHPKSNGVTGAAFARAMETLLDDGVIAIEEIGPPSKRRQRLIIVGGEDTVASDVEERETGDHDPPEPEE